MYVSQNKMHQFAKVKYHVSVKRFSHPHYSILCSFSCCFIFRYPMIWNRKRQYILFQLFHSYCDGVVDGDDFDYLMLQNLALAWGGILE